MAPVILHAEGDTWLIEHESLSRRSKFDDVYDAIRVGKQIASDEGVSFEIELPRNVPLRRMMA